MKGQFLNSKEVKRLLSVISQQWGFDKKLDYVFFQNNRQKVYIVNREFADIDRSKLRISTFGLYLGEVMRNGEFRVSIEGSQIIGPEATKNVITLNRDQMNHWMYGDDLEIELEGNPFVLLQYENTFIGCGKYKDGKILNHVPKNRRIATLDMPN